MTRPVLTRVLGVAAAASAVVLGSAVAAMAGAPSVSMSNPTNGATVTTDRPTISGTVSSTSPNGQITGDLELTITSSAGHPGWSTTQSAWCGRSSCTFSVPVSPALAYNGAYTLSVHTEETDGAASGSSATGSSGSAPQPVTVVSSFTLNAPAAAPSDLTSSVSPDGSFVKLGWNAESYPDLIGYQVTRTPSGAAFPASTSVNRFEDSDVTPGTTYSYSVIAIRKGATSGSTVSSAPATTSVADGSAPPDSGPGAAAGSTPGGTATPTGNAAGLGHYGSAGPSSSSNNSSIAGLLHTSSGAAGSGTPSAQAAPTAPAPPSGPADGVAPGSDNPAVNPFSTGSGGFASASGPGVTITYTTNHAAVVRDYAAVALAALLLAIAAHLLWVRRQLRLTPASVRAR